MNTAQSTPLTHQTLAASSDAQPRAPGLELPPDMHAAVLATGWRYGSCNDGYVFFDRPGYWLRVTEGYDAHPWHCTVMPEDFEAGDWPSKQFPDEVLQQPIVGRQAKLRALLAAKALYEQHRGELEPLGLKLISVGVRQMQASGGCGSWVRTKSYFAVELAQLTNTPEAGQ